MSRYFLSYNSGIWTVVLFFQEPGSQSPPVPIRKFIQWFLPVTASQGFICLIWGKFLSGRTEVFTHVIQSPIPIGGRGSGRAGRVQPSPAAAGAALLTILHCLVLSGI